MTKYATLKDYQPYIDRIMEDLGLTNKVHLTWEFGIWKSMGGDSVLYEHSDSEGRRYGTIRISKEASHRWILETLMHELKHIQQYYACSLGLSKEVSYTTRTGRIAKKWQITWKGEVHDFYITSKTTKKQNKYMNQPWEIEAYTYQSACDRLFPNDALPVAKKKVLVGVVGKTKFYKIAS